MAETKELAIRRAKKKDKKTVKPCKCKGCPCAGAGAIVPLDPQHVPQPMPQLDPQPRGPLGAYEPGGGSAYCTETWVVTNDRWGGRCMYNYCTGIYMFYDGSFASHNDPGRPVQWWQSVANAWNNFKWPVLWHDGTRRTPAGTTAIRG